jgi:hypothetical protein
MIRKSKLEELGGELPGYRHLVSYRAGVPVRELSLDVRVLSKERISALQEFVLRCIDKGVTTVTQIDMILGAGEGLVVRTLSVLHSLDLVDEDGEIDGEVAFKSTERGAQALLESAVRVSTVISTSCMHDGVSGGLKLLNARSRLRGLTGASGEALHALPALREIPEIHELDKQHIRGLLQEQAAAAGETRWEGDVLEVVNLHRRQMKYLAVDVAVFADEEAGQIALRVLERGARLRDYEVTLMAACEERPEILPTEIAFKESSPKPAGGWLSDAERKAAREAAEKLTELEEEIESRAAELEVSTEVQEDERATVSTRERLRRKSEEYEQLCAEKASLERMLEEGARLIETEEHRRLLEKAFKHARSRVIVVSPWLSFDAVDVDFKSWLKGALGRGVEVVIGWGYPPAKDERGNRKNEVSKTVAESLQSISAVKPAKGLKRQAAASGPLRVVHLGDTHEKVLVADDVFAVITSFNFLSFKGSKRIGELALRQERGWEVRIPGRVRTIADDVMARIAKAEERPV